MREQMQAWGRLLEQAEPYRAAIAEGDPIEAERDARNALASAVSSGAYLPLADILEVLADLAIDGGNRQQAARLFGAVEAVRQRTSAVRFSVLQAGYEASVAALREALGEDDFSAAWAEGTSMSTEEAIAYAQRGRGERKRPSSGWASLTPAELDVVRLAREGLGNKDIAAALNLRTRVSPEPGSEQMAAACASLPEALQQPRYDLNALFQLEAALATTAVAIRAEAQTAACLPRLAEPARNTLQAAHAEWQRSESAAAEQAQAQLQQQWKNTRSGGSFEEWKQAVSGGYTRTPQALCDGLAAWLRSPAAKLEQSFAPAPVLTPGVEDEPAPDNSVMAVQLSQPESAVQPLADTAPETATPGASPAAPPAGLFDTLMKAFDERPYESRAPRSQRAHP